MTLFIPDISHHQAGIDIQALANQGAAALIARVGQGAGRRTNGQQYGTTQDREWARHRDEARRVGLPLVAYWYVGNLISPDENARLAEAWVGDKTIPWMIDHEDASGDGAFYCATVDAFRRRGLRVIWGYVPNWYWAGAMARSDLRCGPPVVNSRYSTASGTPAAIYAAAGGDNGNGWINYGGQQTVLWQFTNQGAMAGKAIDVSAFRGTLPQLLQMINGIEEDMALADETFTFTDPNGVSRTVNCRDMLGNLYAAEFYGSKTPPWTGKSSREILVGEGAETPTTFTAEQVHAIAEDIRQGLVEAGVATPDQVDDAVRRAFTRAGQPDTPPTA